jgi:UDP-N-acetyl-2-amino-2-deoxyglucuronate dehydrogenase
MEMGMTQKLQIGVVGCGRVSQVSHFPAIKADGAFHLTAVCDIDPKAADGMAAQFNVPQYYDLSSMLSSHNLDLVAINVPNGLHPRLAQMAVEAGVHVICEKPLGLHLDEIDQLIQKSADKNVEIFTVFQNRYNAPIRHLKRALEKGRFGQVYTCNASVRWSNNAAYYLKQWHADRELGRGAFTNQAVHHLDLLQWLVGAPPESVFARMATAKFAIDVETHGSAIINFRNGVSSTIDVTTLTYGRSREASITVTGEKGVARIGGIALNEVQEWDFADQEDLDTEVLKSSYIPPNVYGFGHVDFYRLVAEQLLSGKSTEQIPDGREGRKSAALLCALYESDRTGMPLRLPIGAY